MMLSVRCFSISAIEHNLAWRVIWFGGWLGFGSVQEA